MKRAFFYESGATKAITVKRYRGFKFNEGTLIIKGRPRIKAKGVDHVDVTPHSRYANTTIIKAVKE